MQLESHKHRYPFRLSAPSFIYAADWITNVQRLGPFVDEIELLFLEIHRQSWPSKTDVVELVRLAKDLDISYNIHLPMDIDMSLPCPHDARKVLEPLAAMIDRTRPLAATTHTLHLDCHSSLAAPDEIHEWQVRSIHNLARLLPLAGIDPGQISVETLDYPPDWLSPVIEALDLSVCVDVGHVIRYGFDLKAVLETFAPRMTIMHLHGVAEGRDHLSLAHLNAADWRCLESYLKIFKGTLSLEVFTLQRLKKSMERLALLLGSK